MPSCNKISFCILLLSVSRIYLIIESLILNSYSSSILCFKSEYKLLYSNNWISLCQTNNSSKNLIALIIVVFPDAFPPTNNAPFNKSSSVLLVSDNISYPVAFKSIVVFFTNDLKFFIVNLTNILFTSYLIYFNILFIIMQFFFIKNIFNVFFLHACFLPFYLIISLYISNIHKYRAVF